MEASDEQYYYDEILGLPYDEDPKRPDYDATRTEIVIIGDELDLTEIPF